MRNQRKLRQSQVTTVNGKWVCKHTELLPGSQKGDAPFFCLSSPSANTVRPADRRLLWIKQQLTHLCQCHSLSSSTHVCALGGKIFQPGWWTMRNPGRVLIFPTSPFNTLFPQYYYWNRRVWNKWNGKWGEGRSLLPMAVQKTSLYPYTKGATPQWPRELPGKPERSLLWWDTLRQPWEKAVSVNHVEKLGIPRGKIWLCN